MIITPGTDVDLARRQVDRIKAGLPAGVDPGTPLLAEGADIVTTTGRWTRQGFRVFRLVELEPEGATALHELTCWHFRRLVAWDILVD